MSSGPWLRSARAVACVAAAGLLLAVPSAADTARHRVLIYYGNETSAEAATSANVAAVLAVLRRSSNPEAATIADNILHDAEHMPRVVARDVLALTRVAALEGFDFFAFTNRMAFEGRYLFHRYGASEERSLPRLPSAPNRILATSPLSRPEFLRIALLEVGSRYPPGTVEAALIVNSHGSESMILMPRVNTDLSLPNAAEGLARSLAAGEGEPLDDAAPAWAALQGTNKEQFWRVLDEASAAHQMRFPFVFLEACASGPFSWSEVRAVPASVGTIAHSAMKSVRPVEIDYARILDRRGGDWIERLSAGLQEHGIRVNSRATMGIWLVPVILGRIPPLWYFVPLALWLAWFGVSTFATRRRIAGRSA